MFYYFINYTDNIVTTKQFRKIRHQFWPEIIRKLYTIKSQNVQVMPMRCVICFTTKYDRLIIIFRTMRSNISNRMTTNNS